MVSEEEMERAEARARLVTSVQRLDACQIDVVAHVAGLAVAGQDISRFLNPPLAEACRTCTEDRKNPSVCAFRQRLRRMLS